MFLPLKPGNKKQRHHHHDPELTPIYGLHFHGGHYRENFSLEQLYL